ncbi:MAG: hypothetical protein WBD95_01290 [Xanthobacteraceae bacterium]
MSAAAIDFGYQSSGVAAQITRYFANNTFIIFRYQIAPPFLPVSLTSKDCAA